MEQLNILRHAKDIVVLKYRDLGQSGRTRDNHGKKNVVAQHERNPNEECKHVHTKEKRQKKNWKKVRKHEPLNWRSAKVVALQLLLLGRNGTFVRARCFVATLSIIFSFLARFLRSGT